MSAGVHLRGLSTAVPPTILPQPAVRDVFRAQPGLNRLAQRIIGTSFDVSGIERRYTVLEELTFDDRGDDPTFFDRTTGELMLPGTKARNEIYAVEATKLYLEAARLAIAATPGVDAADITHVVTVSCTGFYAPAPITCSFATSASARPCSATTWASWAATRRCRRCAARAVLRGRPRRRRAGGQRRALHAAPAFVERPRHDRRVVAVRRRGGRRDRDRPAAGGGGSGRSRSTGSRPRITPVGEGDMAWKIGDHGFEMVLSNAVPSIIDDHITGALEPLFAPDADLADALATDAASGRVAHWAIHPGGRSILDKVESRLQLSEAQLVPARSTLRDFGNMSSATVLFVLRYILDQASAADGDRVAAMAFGPGLTVESALMTVKG